MNSALERFKQLPLAWRIASVAAGVIALGGILFVLRSPKPIAAFVAGLAIVGLLLLARQHLHRRAAARALSPLEQALRGNAGTQVQGISDPARRARLDDLRRSFDSGVQKFRDAGKNLYALPWYLVVGEPGSGKTEAIRHCNVGFPPGLQDQLQGAGGTLNMNWWFTNHAVLLDTAGRLMFEEVEPGTTSEWQEFLKLLRRSRPNCPINGMLLVIPTESLVRDDAGAIERKGTRIAQQLDQIQRTLGVRFPVYIVITKCDLINGFREFFDEIADPQLQHQILGWSNPAPLDAPFNPDLVDQHLAVVRSRLLRRRLGLLQDPVNTQDPKASRTGQVDALYEFPDAMMDIAPRLRRYLSMIFVAGEWSARPLFLRGIYFTSSMREGEALDAKLAEALGVPVESLPEGKVWEKDKSFFLRDLFLSKIFREKGLVTRAAHTGRQQSARRAALFGTAAAGLLLLGGISFLGHRSMNSTLLGPTEFWSGLAGIVEDSAEPADLAAGLSPRALPLVAPNSKGSTEFFYRASINSPDPLLARLSIDDDRKTRARIHVEIKERAEKFLPVPWIYAPIAALGGEADRDIAGQSRARAGRALFDSGVLRTLIDSAHARIKADQSAGRPWSEASTAALVEILRSQAAHATSGEAIDPPRVGPLILASLGSAEAFKAAVDPADVATLDALSVWWCREGLPSSPLNLPIVSGSDLRRMIEGFEDSLDSPPPGSTFASITRLAQSLTQFESAERELHSIEIGKSGPDWISDWGRRFAALKDAGESVRRDLGVLQGRSLVRAFADELTGHREARGREIDALLSVLAPIEPSSTTLPGGAMTPADALRKDLRACAESLSAVKARLSTATRDQTALASALPRLEACNLDSAVSPTFESRFAVYERVNQRLGDQSPPEGDPRQLLTAIDADLESDRQAIAADFRERPGASRESIEANLTLAAGRATALRAAELGASARRAAALVRLGDALPADAASIISMVSSSATRSGATGLTPISAPWIRLAESGEDRGFDADAAARVLADFAAVRSALAASPESLRSTGAAERFARARAAASEYSIRFLDHWSSRLASRVVVVPPDSYQQLHQALAGVPDAGRILDPLAALCERAKGAISAVEPSLDRDDATVASRLAAAKRSLASARSATESPEFRQLCSGLLSRWRALPESADQARRTIAATATGPSPMQPYFVRAADTDFVRATLQGISVSWLRSLAAPGAAVGSAAPASVPNLRELDRFPLNKFSRDTAPLSPAELALARAAAWRIAAGDSSIAPPGACDRPISDDAEINDAARALLGCAGAGGGGAGTGTLDPSTAARWKRLFDVLPEDPSRSMCRITLLTDRPPRSGARPVTSASHLLMLVAEAGDGGPPRGTTVPVRSGETLGTVSLAARSILIERKSDGGTRSMGRPFTVEGPWIPMRLIDEFGGTPVDAQRKAWDVEMIFTAPEGSCSVWVRLEFEFSLPAPPWYR